MTKLVNEPGQKYTPLSSKKHEWITGFFMFLLKALIWMTIVYFIASKFAVSHFWIVVLGVFIFSVPICICGVYTSTIHKIHRLTRFSKQGWIFRLLSGRSLKIIFWVCWSLVSSFFMLIQFHTYDSFQWKVFFLTIPVFWIIFTLSRRLIADELKPYWIINTALEWSRGLCPLIMLIIYIVLNLYFGEIPKYSSIIDAVNAKKSAAEDMTGSVLVWKLSQSLAFYDGIKAYALGRFGEQETIWATLVLGIGGFIVFYNACAMLSCLLIPCAEYRRIFVPLSATDKPQSISSSRIAAITGITTFLIFFIYVPIFTYIEEWAQQTPKIDLLIKSIEPPVTVTLEQIDKTYFKEGTFDKLQKAKAEALHKVDASLTNLDGQIDTAFNKLESNVDNYLNWYYSLAGEYGRIGNMLMGELDDYMKEKLEESLKQEDAFKEVQVAITETLELHEAAQKNYQQAAERIMAENRVDPAYFSVDVMHSMSLTDALNPPIHNDIINMKNRLMLGAGGGAIAGLITAAVGKKIVGKVVGKSVLKLASKALTKVFVTKTAGSAVGAASGAVVGSIVPGFGTAIGAVIGGILGGITVGLTVDKLILMLEESMSRQEFKNEILASIDEARTEFKSEWLHR